MDRILVTGANGFIGGAVARLLAEYGFEVFGLDRQKPAGLAADASWIDLDLTAEQARTQLDSLPRFDAVVHCAAVIPSSFTGTSADLSRLANARIDGAVIDYCQRREIRLIYCSGTAVYGYAVEETVAEDHVVDPSISPYIFAKMQAENLIRAKLASHAVLRICAPYGPHQKTRTVLRIFIESALNGSALTYHGSGSREQDFVHVEDVAAAILSAIRRPTANGVFNVAGGAPVSMKELAHLVARVVGNPQAKICASGRPDSQENYRARFSIRRAEELLGWKPTIKLEQGIREWAAQLAGSER